MMKSNDADTDPSNIQTIDSELLDVKRVVMEIGVEDFERVCFKLRGYLIPETLRKTVWNYRFLYRGPKEHPLTMVMTKELTRRGT
jgi:hypothetical protein